MTTTGLESESSVRLLHYDILPALRTKVFIRFPKTLFDIEDRLQKRRHELGKQ